METSSGQHLWKYLRPKLPRIITQLSRDPDSPTYGSWDRNFWHYKMRDFSSVILQQGMLVLNSLKNYDSDGNILYRHPLADLWIDASLRFWADQQLRNGSFNEYYPHESGYPPTAFSLYATGLILKSRSYQFPGEKVKMAVQKAIDWLMKHPEKEALNQEAAGLAGIILCSSLQGITVDIKVLEERFRSFYASQSNEGWFPEYGGPDTGYLSVTIDCLWDIFETAKDKRAFAAMEKAIGFIASMVSVSGETPVMINSRNTDYLVLYGITRMAAAGNAPASAIIRRILSNFGSPDHFLNRTDDRYAVHYVYSSYFRSLTYLDDITSLAYTLPEQTDFLMYHDQAGIYIRHLAGKTSIFMNLRKGGIINIFNSKAISDADYGWRAKIGKKQVAVTHWLNPAYQIEDRNDNSFKVSGRMTRHAWMVPDPAKHMLLRLTSYVIGSRIIPMLKKILIFGEKEIGIHFIREIHLEKNYLTITDTFSGPLLDKLKLYRAPHFSLRHVSSAGQFIPEELILPPHDEGTWCNAQLVYTRKINFVSNE